MATAPKRPTFSFTCGDCDRTEHSADEFPPMGWDVIEPATIFGQAGMIRCPDCAEMVEQQHFARHTETAPDHAPAHRASQQSARPGCMLALADGGYRIIVSDAGVNRTPIGMILTPMEAMALAHELARFVEMAIDPGRMVATETRASPAQEPGQ